MHRYLAYVYIEFEKEKDKNAVNKIMMNAYMR